jgi:hypothetical protein
MGNKKTSDAVQTAVRFEARIWRAGYHQQAVSHCDYNEECKSSKTAENACTCACYDCKSANAKPQGEDVPASWAVYAIDSGVRMDYSKDEEAAKKTAEKWNAGNVPEVMKMKAESAHDLLELLKPGDTVKTILRHCSRSGMSRRISLVIARDSEVTDITWDAARVMGDPIKQGGKYVQAAGLVVGGCGMDMGFHVVYNLGRYLWPDGFVCPGETCQSNDHSNNHGEEWRRKNFKGQRHTGDGGYALKQAWL